MPTFGHWEDEVLEHTFDHVDYISLHTYLNNYSDDTAAFLAIARPDGPLHRRGRRHRRCASRRERRSTKRIMLSFDEWNVWYRTRRNRADRVKEGWPVAPPILEEIYTMEDALAFGGACISLLNHADRVKVACLAQLVNVIAPIMTETGGPAWRQTIFYPVRADEPLRPRQGPAHAGRVARLTLRPTTIRAAPRISSRCPNVPYLKLAAVADEAGGLSLFLLNRDLKQEMAVSASMRAASARSPWREAHELRHDDLKAINSKERAGAREAVPARGGDRRRRHNPRRR